MELNKKFMQKLLSIFLILFSSYCLGQTVPIAQTIPNDISYTLPSDEAHVSVGVYDMSGHLLRTLKSNVAEKVGTHSAYWDGKDEDGNQQVTGTNFQLKVIYNNDVFTWNYVIGNTSTNTTGANIWKAGSQICSMWLNGSSMYCATGFSEGNASQHLFNTSTPQVSTVYSSKALQTGQGTYFNVGSSKYLFNAGADYIGGTYFVFPERLSNNTEITFALSKPTTPSIGRSYNGLDASTAPITSLACQQNGNGYLFVGHGSLNSIDVIRTSDSIGTKVQTISLSGITALSVDRDNDNILWIARGTTISKYTINSDGTLVSSVSTITGFSNVVSLHIQGGEIAVADAGTQQICKFYNSTTLAQTRTLGRVGGYINDPNVYNNKFYWSDVRGSLYTFIIHDGSGGIWVGDPGNSRSLHFDSSGNYIEMIMYIGTYITYAPSTNTGMSYSVNICGNHNTSIFTDYLEFNIDYTQPTATAWTLIKNWGYNLPAGWHGKGNLNGVYLYPNGREFAIIGQTPNSYLAELNSTGMHIIMSALPQFCAFDKSGNLTTFNATNTTNSARPLATAAAILTYYKYPVTVPNSGNPTIGSAITIATIQSGYSDPLPQDRTVYITTSGKIVVFDNTLSPSRDLSGAHKYFEAIYDSTTCTRIARFRLGTPVTYQGDYLLTGEYDTGNSLNYNGGSTAVAGNYIIDNDHGENWKQSEIGMYHLWSDNGLLMGTFGALGPQTVPAVAPFGFSSNTLKTNATLYGGNLHLWLNDESQHAGTHWWKITNMGSEGSQTINFQLTNRTYVAQNNVTDYLANVPAGQVSIQGLAGVSQSPTTDIRNLSNHNAAGQFYSVTATQNFYPNLSHDVTLYATFGAGTRHWDINVSTPSQWTFYGQLNLTVNSMVSIEGSTALNYIQLLDNAGKVIARIYMYRTNRINFNNNWFGPFTNSHYGASDFVIQRKQGTNNVYFTIDMWGQQLTTTLPMYDVTADITHPAIFEVVTVNLNQGFQISINKFYSIN